MQSILINALALSIAMTSVASTNLVCYFTNWSRWRQGEASFTPAHIDPFICTHILYAFAKIEAHQLVPSDPDTDVTQGYFKQVTDLKRRNPQLKVFIAVGGYNQNSSSFSPMVSSSATRRTFILSVVEFLKTHNFDGIDIDWEFPTLRGGAATDRANFVSLIRELRAKFQHDASMTGRPVYEIVLAVPAIRRNIVGFDQRQLCSMVQMVLVMTYDYHGPWNDATGPNAPMYGKTTDRHAEYNSLTGLVNWASNGCPREKVVLGIPLYARTWTLNAPVATGTRPTWGMRGTAGRPGPFTKAAGILAYYEYCRDVSASVFDPDYRVSYGVRKGDQFYTYDGPESMRHKAHFVRQNRIGGAMVWAIDQDDFSGSICSQGRYPLLRSLRYYLFYTPPQQCTFTCPAPYGVYADTCSNGYHVCNGQGSRRYSCAANTSFNRQCLCCRPQQSRAGNTHQQQQPQQRPQQHQQQQQRPGVPRTTQQGHPPATG